jgi:hypothetical protein
MSRAIHDEAKGKPAISSMDIKLEKTSDSKKMIYNSENDKHNKSGEAALLVAHQPGMDATLVHLHQECISQFAGNWRTSDLRGS